MAVMESPPRLQRFPFTSFDAKEEQKVLAKTEQPTAKKEPAPNMPPATIPLPLALPAITEKDVQNARTEAQAAGYREGYAAAQGKFNKEAATREEAVNGLLEIIANRITIAAESHSAGQKEREQLMSKLVMAVARKVAGEALRREPYSSVETLLKECTSLIAGKSSVKVVVSNTLAAGLKQRIDMLKPMLNGFNGELLVEEDEHLLDQDCRVEWGNGYGERDLEDLWHAIEGIIIKTNVNN